MFFELAHSSSENEFDIRYGERIDFPLHIHRSFEFYVQVKGLASITVDEKTYVLQGGQAVLIFPYQMHSYKSSGDDSAIILGFFSPEMVGEFYKIRHGFIPKNNVFDFSVEIPDTTNVFLKKAFAYKICGLFDVDRKYFYKDKTDIDLAKSILLYIEKNFAKKCSLKDVSAYVGYDYSYISKFFKRKFGITLKNYVNGLRIQRAVNMLKNTGRSVIDIALDCGFGCLRSFDREFLSIIGLKPTEYRKSVAKNI